MQRETLRPYLLNLGMPSLNTEQFRAPDGFISVVPTGITPRIDVVSCRGNSKSYVDTYEDVSAQRPYALIINLN